MAGDADLRCTLAVAHAVRIDTKRCIAMPCHFPCKFNAEASVTDMMGRCRIRNQQRRCGGRALLHRFAQDARESAIVSNDRMFGGTGY
ncbi:hypothetical protein WJ74_33885 [Burkholderia ubonensis]|nr:hypothetical protein WJ74_33885 [Burkholderia ubonensis]